MKGIVESHDGEHLEKNKVMALISKTYMLYYLDKKNPHPSIPANASYNAIDDARIFQKYAGAGVEQTITKRYQALDQTRNQLLVYQGTIPILPYFSCSAGFTRSGKEKR
jgi:peptidoglycan hydrolase-like amidase